MMERPQLSWRQRKTRILKARNNIMGFSISTVDVSQILAAAIDTNFTVWGVINLIGALVQTTSVLMRGVHKEATRESRKNNKNRGQPKRVCNTRDAYSTGVLCV